MIVPGTRLLLWVGVAGVPLATAAGLFPEAGPVCAAGLAGLAGLAVADAWRGWRIQRHAGLRVGLPTTVRLPVGRPGRLPLRVEASRGGCGRLHVALAWPGTVRPTPETVTVPLPAGESVHHLEWPCIALRRGLSRLGAAYLETLSPWRLWQVRRSEPLGSDLRAYPDLLRERRHVAALFLNRGASGVHAQRVVGRGREFEKLREYAPGDSYEDIHWKSTARRGRPVTKTYQMERTQEVYVLLDASRLSGRIAPRLSGDVPGEAALESTVLERLVTATLVLALAAGRQGDLFGLMAFSDRVRSFLRARGGQAHFQACRDLLLRIETQPVAPDFNEVFTFARLRLRRRALLVVLTALDDPVLAEEFVRSVALVERQHLVLVNVLRPAWVEPMFTRPAIPSIDALYAALAGHLRWHDLRELQQGLRHRGVRLGLLEHERLTADLVRQYLEVKRRQQL